MGQRIKLATNDSNETGIIIDSASVSLDADRYQCWCVKLRLCWQSMSIEGWAFLSSWWGELLFQRVFDGQPPHFVSGKLIETDYCNDLLWQFGEDIGIHPKTIANEILRVIGQISFIMPHVCLISAGITVKEAMAFHYVKENYRLRFGRTTIDG